MSISVVDLLKQCAGLSAEEVHNDPNCIIERESIVLNGRSCTLNRVYLRKPTAGNYTDVGWVLDGDVSSCMICSKDFWLLVSRHHCRSCGNIICDECSPHALTIKELPTIDPERVCLMCYWGQVMYRQPVFAHVITNRYFTLIYAVT